MSFALWHEDPLLYNEEIISISKQLLTTATQSGEYFGAIRNLCYAYKTQGSLEEAKRYASMAGRYIGTENQLMIHILEGEEAVSFCRWNIETIVELITDNFSVMLKKGNFSNDEHRQTIRLVLNILNLLNDDGHYGNQEQLIHKWQERLNILQNTAET